MADNATIIHEEAPVFPADFATVVLEGVSSAAASALASAAQIRADGHASEAALSADATSWVETVHIQLISTATRVRSFANHYGTLSESDIDEMTGELAAGQREVFSEVIHQYVNEAQSNAARLASLGANLETFTAELSENTAGSTQAGADFVAAADAVRNAVTAAAGAWTKVADNFSALIDAVAKQENPVSSEDIAYIRRKLIAGINDTRELKASAEEHEVNGFGQGTGTL